MQLLFSICLYKSKAVWKKGLEMDDPDYLPPPPLFMLTTQNNEIIFADALIYHPTKVVTNRYKELFTNRSAATEIFVDMRNKCSTNESNACLCLGRIYEFGAFGTVEDQELAIQYYQKALSYGNEAAYSPLAFLIRHLRGDIPMSVLYEDLSPNYIETILSTSKQHLTGTNRPQSNDRSVRLLLKAAEPVVSMVIPKLDQTLHRLTKDEIQRYNESTDPAGKFKLGIHYISVPYPSEAEAAKAYGYLKEAYDNHYIRAVSVIVLLHTLYPKLKVDEKFTKKTILSDAAQLKDPLALILLAQMETSESLNFIRDAVKLGSMQAKYVLGFYTYYGLFGIPRSNTKAFTIFKQTAANGVKESILFAARQLIGGDGVLVNSEEATRLLRLIVDSGPWTVFYDRYVHKGSKYAFDKMIDLNLSPEKWIDSNTTMQREPTLKDEKLKRLRLAHQGDGESVIWLALQQPFPESIEWMKTLKMMKPTVSILYVPVYLLTIYRGLLDLKDNKLDDAGKEALVQLFTPILGFLPIFASFVALLILIAARLRLFFIE